MSDHVEMNGTVVQVNREKFSVKIENTDTIVMAQLSGKMRLHRIRVTLGDRIVVRLSPFDLTHGIISSRK